MNKVNPQLKAAVLDLFSTILDCNHEKRCEFWLDFSGHVNSLSVRAHEGSHQSTNTEYLGNFSTYLDIKDDDVKYVLEDIANKKASVLEVAARWTDDKLLQRELETKERTISSLKEQLAALEGETK